VVARSNEHRLLDPQFVKESDEEIGRLYRTNAIAPAMGGI